MILRVKLPQPRTESHYDDRTSNCEALPGCSGKPMWPAVKATLHYTSLTPTPCTPSSVGCRRRGRQTATRSSTSTSHRHSSRSLHFPEASGHKSDPTTSTSASTAESAAAPQFPNRDAIIFVVGTVRAEQTDKWAEGRPTYLGLDILTKAPHPRPRHRKRGDRRTRPRTQRITSRSKDTELHHYRGLDHGGHIGGWSTNPVTVGVRVEALVIPVIARAHSRLAPA